MNDIDIRPATDDELGAVAQLRWQWLLESQGAPTVTHEEFVDHFVVWAQKNTYSHRCVVIVRGKTVIGMAWLVTVQRVPTPHAPERASGDVQCVYVVPDERDSGPGSQLIDAVLELACDLGLERITVHSSPRAILAYARRGFVTSPRLMQVRPADFAEPEPPG